MKFRLIGLAGLITAFAYLLAALGENSEIPAGAGTFLIALLLLVVVAHFAVKYLASVADRLFLPLAVFLHGIGFVMITRLSDRLSGLQATWSLIGIGAFVATLVIVQRVNDLARYKWGFFTGGVFLLLLPLVPGLGFTNGGARIWVNLGPINFQPGEFAKIALAIFVAGYLAERRELIAAGTWTIGRLHLPEPRDVLPLLAAWGVSVIVMVGEKDLGSSLLFFMLFVVMLWVATEKTSYLMVGLSMFAVGAVIAYNMFDHVRDRVEIWLDPWSQYSGKGYQVVQGMFAFGAGGYTGSGLGKGFPTRIPAAQNDFIFAAIGEELGLLGCTAILAAFVLLIGAGLRTASRTQRPFEQLLATGLTLIFGLQAFIIIGGVLRVVPLTGVALPFVSYGGSSLVANYVLLAILVRISDGAARQVGDAPDTLTLSERWELRKLRKAANEPAN